MAKSISIPVFARRAAYFTLFTISFMILLAGIARAQVSDATLNGAVRDQSGAVITGATVNLRNLDTAVEKTTTSNGAGEYTFQSITPGRYTLEATAAGFSPKQISEFILSVGQAAAIDFSLSVGTESQKVTVEARRSSLKRRAQIWALSLPPSR